MQSHDVGIFSKNHIKEQYFIRDLTFTEAARADFTYKPKAPSCALELFKGKLDWVYTQKKEVQRLEKIGK